MAESEDKYTRKPSAYELEQRKIVEGLARDAQKLKSMVEAGNKDVKRRLENELWVTLIPIALVILAGATYLQKYGANHFVTITGGIIFPWLVIYLTNRMKHFVPAFPMTIFVAFVLLFMFFTMPTGSTLQAVCKISAFAAMLYSWSILNTSGRRFGMIVHDNTESIDSLRQINNMLCEQAMRLTDVVGVLSENVGRLTDLVGHRSEASEARD